MGTNTSLTSVLILFLSLTILLPVIGPKIVFFGKIQKN